MDEKKPTYPLIVLHCAHMGSMSYYMLDEIERARSVNAPRDTWAAGSFNGEVQIKRWRDIANEGYKQKLADECVKRYGVHPDQLI